MALKKFQREHGLTDDGVFGGKTRDAMEEALSKLEHHSNDPKMVRIVGGNCYVRSAPNTSGAILGVAHRDESFNYGGQTTQEGWNLIDFRGKNGWVSGKYSKLE